MKTHAIKKLYNHTRFSMVLTALLLMSSGCEDVLEVDNPVGQIPTEDVFNDEGTATAAVSTIYAKLRDQAFLTGNLSGTSHAMGLYADELDYYDTPGFPLESVYTHQVLPSNTVISSLWNETYQIIYLSNAVLEGVSSSSELAQNFKNQLRGEALFIRALSHFYLVNLYGAIPYITTTDYVTNSEVERVPVTLVYEMLRSDLREAKMLLGVDYNSAERVRANTYVVSALMARVYLYLEEWQDAEMESSLLLNNATLFALEPNVQDEFLKESTSAIFQFKPKNEGDNTLEAAVFKFESAPPPRTALTTSLVGSMDESDQRKLNWIGEVSNGTDTFYFPNKYKENTNTGASVEYSIVFRIAEQYLIRSEARLMQGNILGAIDDLNTIRNRAGLEDTNATTTSDVLDALIQERRFELFTEFGHRWFDLRRYGLATDVLAPIKTGWKPTDVLLPLPEDELLMNPNLSPQNPGY